MGIWETRIRRSDKIPVALVRIEPIYEISWHRDESYTAWTTHGTFSSVKVRANTEINFKGRSKRIRFLAVNGKEHQRVGSPALCNSTDVSWYQDRIVKELNVNPKGSLDMDTTVVRAIFAVHFSTHHKRLAGEEWLQRVDPKSDIFSSHSGSNDPKFSSSSISGGSLRLLNGDGYFDGLHPDPFNFENARVTVWIGLDLPGAPMAFTDYKKIKTVEVAKYQWGDKSVEMRLEQITQRLRSTATDIHYDSDTGDTDAPVDESHYAGLDKSHEGERQAIIGGATDSITGLTELQLWEIANKTYCVNKGNTLFQGTQFKICRTMTNPESDDVHGLKTLHAVLHKKVGGIVKVQSTSWRGFENNTGVELPTSGVTNPKYPVNVNAGEEIRIVVDGLADVGGKFTGSGTSRIDDGEHWLHYFGSHAGLLAREIWIPEFTAVGEKKTITTLFSAATAGDTLIFVSMIESIEEGYVLKIGTDDNSGAGYTVTDAYEDRITISPALGTSQAAGVNVQCFGTYVKKDWHDACRIKVEDKHNYESIINQLGLTLRAVPCVGRHGKWRLIQLEDTPSSSAVVIKDDQMLDWAEWYDRSNTSDRVVVEYAVCPASGNRRKKRSAKTVSINGKSVWNRISKALYLREKEDVWNTLGTGGNKAKNLANSGYATYGRGVRMAETTERRGSALDLLQGQQVIIYRRRSMTGPLVRKLFWAVDPNPNWITFHTKLVLMEAKL